MNQPSPSPTYLLEPVACQHRDQSRRMILAAAQTARPRQILVLGAGRCREIPVTELAARCDRLVLNDVAAEELALGVADAALDAELQAKLELDTTDLTGLTVPLLAACDEALAKASDPQQAAESLGALLDHAPDGQMALPGPFDLIVASCLLSQLHFGLAQGALERFEQCFAGQGEVLRTNTAWTAALFRRARRMEARLIHDMAARLAPGGLLYLSESMQMCQIELTASGKWQTAGRSRMLPAQLLADYLDRRFVLLAREGWNWVVTPPIRPGDSGRLFDVQALVARMG